MKSNGTVTQAEEEPVSFDIPASANYTPFHILVFVFGAMIVASSFQTYALINNRFEMITAKQKMSREYTDVKAARAKFDGLLDQILDLAKNDPVAQRIVVELNIHPNLSPHAGVQGSTDAPISQ